MSIESAIKAIHAAGLSDTQSEQFLSNDHLRRIVEVVLSEQWEPIETAPKDETPILAWISSKWVEGMFWNGSEWSYLSDGDITPTGRFQPKYWKPFPQSPEDEA